MSSKRTAQFFSAITTWLGSTTAVILAISLIMIWLVGAAFIHGGLTNDSYQLLINSLTTIITFVMVFIIQNTTNRESKAMNAKMDALIKTVAPDLTDPDLKELIGIEEEPEETIDVARSHIKED